MGVAKVVTVAAVFTDILDSTKLGKDLGDAVWEGIRQQHFAQAVRLIHRSQGILIKNTGDGILALFHHATAAVDFVLSLHDDTGHAVVRIRAGVHTGQANLDDGDAFARHMNQTARVMGSKASGVTVSSRARAEITHHPNLRWEEFPNVTLKGFPHPETLWTVEKS
jgi:class 3 adenylate cyclase